MAHLCPDPLMYLWQSAQLCRRCAIVCGLSCTAASWANALDPTHFWFCQKLTESESKKETDWIKVGTIEGAMPSVA